MLPQLLAANTIAQSPAGKKLVNGLLIVGGSALAFFGGRWVYKRIQAKARESKFSKDFFGPKQPRSTYTEADRQQAASQAAEIYQAIHQNDLFGSWFGTSATENEDRVLEIAKQVQHWDLVQNAYKNLHGKVLHEDFVKHIEEPYFSQLQSIIRNG